MEKFEVYYPYVVKEGQTPDMLADEFYNDSELDWVIYLSNKITDPYYGWPLSYKDFLSYLEMKYNVPSQTTQSMIEHYIYTGVGESDVQIARKSWTISQETFNNLSTEEKAGWTPEYVYDLEFKSNEDKRHIRLLSPAYVEQLRQEMAEILLT